MILDAQAGTVNESTDEVFSSITRATFSGSRLRESMLSLEALNLPRAQGVSLW
jgi:hypothetical protein